MSQTFFEFLLQDANFCLKKLALAFLTACVYWFLTSLKNCISRGLFDANVVFVLVKGSQVWSEPRAISVPGSNFLNGACLFKMVREELLKNNRIVLYCTRQYGSLGFSTNVSHFHFYCSA